MTTAAVSSPSGPRLIVNADDFGLSPAVNAGVVRAHTHGILTSATLMANGPAFTEAVALAARHPTLGVGVHLNLVRGRPISPPDAIPLLVDCEGGLRRFRIRRLTAAFMAQAEAEYRRQLEKVTAAGIVPTHVDFEKHHAWQGPLYRLACRLAGEYSIPAVRTFREPVVWSLRRLGWPGWRRAAMAAALRAGFFLGGGGTLASPDRLLGQTHIGAMDEAAWLRLLASPPPGLSEVMVHPAEAEADAGGGPMGASWLGRCRATELAALVSPRVREAVTRGGVRLVSFALFRAGGEG